MLEKLPEFQFKFGDPRMILYNYLMSFSSTMSFIKTTPRSKQLVTKMKFMCKGIKREIIIPPLEAFNLEALQGDKSLLIIPVILKSQTRCGSPNTAKHLNVLIYNKNTHELERIDIKKYHLEGFGVKNFLKKIFENVVPFIQEVVSHEIEMVPELDIPYAFVKKMEMENIKDAYPFYMITYLHLKCENPYATSEEHVKKMRSISKARIMKCWQHYTEFRERATKNEECKLDYVKNYSTGRCMAPLSSNYIKNLIEKPVPKCPEKKVFNHMTRKCTDPKNLFDINILLDKASQSKLTNKTVFTSLDKEEISLKAALFVLSKYPYAFLIYPRETDTQKLKKTDFKIMWKWSKKDEEFKLTFPKGFWDTWKQGMYDPTIRFIISYLSLKAELGAHANVIIYDKATNEMERFDSHGQYLSEKYRSELLDEQLKEAFKEHDDIVPKDKFKYFAPISYCPKMPVFQSKEVDDIPGVDLTGNCAVWRLWYVNIRMENPTVNRKKLVRLAAHKLEHVGGLYNFIKSYQLYIHKNLKKGQKKLSSS
jgi:hypothetical protein